MAGRDSDSDVELVGTTENTRKDVPQANKKKRRLPWEGPAAKPATARPVASSSRIASTAPNGTRAAANRSRGEDTGVQNAAVAAEVRIKQMDKGKARDNPINLDSGPEHDHKGKVGYAVEEEGEAEGDLIAVTNAICVGLQYYPASTRLTASTSLVFERDSGNRFDANAIRVLLGSGGAQVGHLDRLFASKLAPLMDSGEVEPVANVVSLARCPYAVDIRMELYGSSGLADDPRLAFVRPGSRAGAAIASNQYPERVIKGNGRTLPWEDGPRGTATSRMSRPGRPTAGTISKLVQGSSQAQPHAPDLLTQFFASEQDLGALPEHPDPPGRKNGLLKTDLLKHQSQALAWMIKMEHPQAPRSVGDAPTQLWSLQPATATRPKRYQNLADPLSVSLVPPILHRGGILADAMGLGKTLTTIGLVMEESDGSGLGLGNKRRGFKLDERYEEITLVVCPLSVLSNWDQQLTDHVGKNGKKLAWAMYHGDGRKISRAQLLDYDVILTTYQTVSGEYNADSVPPAKKKAMERSASEDSELGSGGDRAEPRSKKVKNGLLFQIPWRRVVLDEGHVIRNRKAKMSRACCALMAERRWVLTGTPLINAAKDLGSLVGFLRVCQPLDQAEVWNKLVEVPVKRDNASGRKLLGALVRQTTLRRTKEMKGSDGEPIVKLPALTFYLHKVQLAEAEKKVYDEVATLLSQQFMRFHAAGEARSAYTTILVWLLRLRQLACDPALCPASFLEEARDATARAGAADSAKQATSLSSEDIKALRKVLMSVVRNDEDCAICFGSIEDPAITPCKHVFCRRCLVEALERSREAAGFGQCPMDRRPVSAVDLVELPPPDEADELVQGEGDQPGIRLEGSKTYPAKAEELVRLLQATESDVKSLVFSQWTSHLDRIGSALKDNDIAFCRLDGSMPQKERQKVLRNFSQPGSDVRVMLLSLKAGALGLNLTVASQVFLLDPWWQHSIERQAIDRVYRIGQRRDVRIFQMVAEGTVEEKVLDIQRRKDKLIAQAFSGGGRSESESAGVRIESRMTDLAEIFGIGGSSAA